MVQYHFITFATPEYVSFAQDNVASALRVGGFDTAKVYTMEDIDDYYKLQNAHIFKQSRFAGYCIWKPYVIFKRLLEIDENDILCYNDSKYIWRTNVRNMETQLLTNKHIGVYMNKPNSGTHVEKQWTKGDTFLLMNVSLQTNILHTPQVWAGFILLRKKFNPIRFVSEWLTYVQDARIVTDLPTKIVPNDPIFTEHRHDQSILSVLCKKWGIPMDILDKEWMIDLRNPI